jgi:hypothetical protein
MLKFTSLALAQPIGTIIGLIAAISIAPTSEAISATNEPISLQQAAGEIDSQIIAIQEGDRRGNYRREDKKDRYRSRYDRDNYRRNDKYRSRNDKYRSRDRDENRRSH